MINREHFRKNMENSFGMSDLRALVFDLQENFDAFEGNLSDRIIAVIQHFEKRGRLPELIAKCEELRPLLDWRSDDKPAEAQAPLPIQPETESISRALQNSESVQDLESESIPPQLSESTMQGNAVDSEVIDMPTLHNQANLMLNDLKIFRQNFVLSPIMIGAIWEISKELNLFFNRTLAFFKLAPNHSQKLVIEHYVSILSKRTRDIKTIFDQEMANERESSGTGNTANIVDELSLLEAEFATLNTLLSSPD